MYLLKVSLNSFQTLLITTLTLSVKSKHLTYFTPIGKNPSLNTIDIDAPFF